MVSRSYIAPQDKVNNISSCIRLVYNCRKLRVVTRDEPGRSGSLKQIMFKDFLVVDP